MKGLHRRFAAGLTLIELMIAVTVALILLAALAAMYGSSIKTRNEIERSHRQIENGRYALQVLRDDIQLAGYYGELNMRDLELVTPPAVPDVCMTHLVGAGDSRIDDIVTANVAGDAGITGLDYLAAVMPLHIQGFDVDGGVTAPTCLADVRPGTDIIAVRRVLTCISGETDCPFTANAAYLQASQCDDEIQADNFFLLRADANVSQFTLRTLACNAAELTPIRRWVTHIYFIANNNVAGDGMPTLKRMELISTGFTTVALVEGIEDMQFEYGVDNTGDGTPDVYKDDPGDSGVAATDAQAWRDTMTVRVHLLSRATEERAGYADSNTYTLGTKAVAATGDAYRRQVFQTLIQMRNPAGRRQ